MSLAVHELVAAFDDAGLSLRPTLVEMLEEHCHHRTQRRGCGYTQATRFLSSFVNLPRSPDSARDITIFRSVPVDEVETLAQQLIRGGWANGWRRLDEAPESAFDGARDSATLRLIRELPGRLRGVRARLVLEENVLLLDLIEQVLMGLCPPAPELPGMPQKPDIGSCSMAEELFLEIAHGRVRRGGRVNVFVGETGEPLLVEKINLGESHSAVVVNPVRINGIWIAPGALCALDPRGDDSSGKPIDCGLLLPLAAIRQARFLRLTTLAVAPAIRQRAFAHQLEAQLQSGLFSPKTTTIEQLRDFAAARAALA